MSDTAIERNTDGLERILAKINALPEGSADGNVAHAYATAIAKEWEGHIPMDYFQRADGSYLTEIGAYAFEGSIINGVDMPDTIRLIGQYAFANCPNLQSIRLPSDLEVIDSCAFSIVGIGGAITIPKNCKFIYESAFKLCLGLTEVTFQCQTPSFISASTFSSCRNLTTINVPWSEGEVENAPWGATNATINYNCTVD